MRRQKVTAKPPADPEREHVATYVGYARVSTADQNIDMQVAALVRAGVHPDNIHAEHVSGVHKRRPGRDLALKACRPGDTIVVYKLDRVGRSVRDLLAFTDKLEAAGVHFKSIHDTIDTGTPAGRVMFVMLAAFAQFERDVIAERTAHGMASAKARGQTFGAPPKVTEEVERDVVLLIGEGWTMREIANKHKLHVNTLRKRFGAARLQEIRDAAERAKRKRKRD